ncbi:MAG: ATP-binding protein [Clostridia bacterium]|nr:ATP-binding protein [Clostridia bacterium]
MKERYCVTVRNKRLQYDFEITGKITVVRGDSATGKTTLVEMIRLFERHGADSGVEVIADVPCRVLDNDAAWAQQLSWIRGSLVFVDENHEFTSSPAFARAILESDNDYVLMTRANLPCIPKNAQAIFGIRFAGQKDGNRRVHHEFFHLGECGGGEGPERGEMPKRK